MQKRHRLPVIALALAAAAVSPALAQDLPPSGYRQVISANPFGLLLEIFNAEYERALSDAATFGVGGSTISSKDERYVNADIFFRYYPTIGAFEGWAFGGKLGLTNVPEHGTYLGYGFDVNRSWLLGKKHNFYVGVGFGLKRLVGGDDEGNDEDGDGDLLEYIPTFRIINIGFAF